jgi:hypothetical protein
MRQNSSVKGMLFCVKSANGTGNGVSLSSSTLLVVGALIVFSLVLKKAFKTIRPIFRERGKITAEVTGRSSELSLYYAVLTIYLEISFVDTAPFAFNLYDLFLIGLRHVA